MAFPSGSSNGSGTQVASLVSGEQRRVGLVYDERMCNHSTPRGEDHPENPDRIRAIWNKLVSAGIPQRCVVFNAKEVKDTYIAEVHTNNHINLIKTISSKKLAPQRNRVAAKYNSIYFNEGSSEAAYLAAGSVLEAAEKVAKGELNSAFAIVRPPGHHAEENQPMGFCLYNNIAIATSFLLNQKELDIKKILIVDWDVHHGNGTQKMFWKDSRVLFFSVHRHEFGSFYPAGDDGHYIMMGEGPGAGYNINVPWENGQCGDADYNAVWDYILIPVAREFNPDIILISAGFDAAIGDPLGGCRITPHGYSIMLKKLMEFSKGKIVMALEGGYNLNSLANSVLACVEMLLEDKPIVESFEVYPFESTWSVIKAVREELSAFWPVLAEKLPEKLPSRVTPQVQIYSSQSDDEYDDGPNTLSEDLQEDVTIPLSKLKVSDDAHDAGQAAAASPAWRSELSKIDVWYASFGSNMSESRFRCYIEGGQAEGMRRPCKGAVDKSQPKEVLWKIVPHRLFFGRESTITWGPGGVAFLHPASSDQEKTYMCLYRITLEQFNDVLLQENVLTDTSSPFFDLNALDSIENEKNIPLEALKDGWYHNVVYLGKEKDIPILTMTCTVGHVEDFKSGKTPICAPAKEYADTLVRGLVLGKQLSEDEATVYIQEASTKPL
ncbi:histone deacetylase 5 [Cynara cardunculus var. scolymus]|uniref:histone deacetylase 5 n=1 Tax=Cynara cardunculus var. scolymus TaxID=59895 RepID=UPI000D625728|nr:histone deacetylase 5 [Cynara cardunculus var. scolymus]